MQRMWLVGTTDLEYSAVQLLSILQAFVDSSSLTCLLSLRLPATLADVVQEVLRSRNKRDYW